MGCEAWHAAEDGGAKEDAPDDFGDDAGLAHSGEWIVEEAGEDYDYTGLVGGMSVMGLGRDRAGRGKGWRRGPYLYDEDDDGVLGVPVSGVLAGDDAGLL